MALFSTTTTTGAASPCTTSATVRVSADEFAQLLDFIYEQCGIYIAETRKYLVENRLGNRLKELNLKNFGEYDYYLRVDANRRAELPKLFEVITTNESSFYRNPPQLQGLQRDCPETGAGKDQKNGCQKIAYLVGRLLYGRRAVYDGHDLA